MSLQTMIAAVIGTLFFAGAGYLGILLGTSVANRITPFEDGPPAENPPLLWLIAGCALLGSAVVTHATAPAQVVLIAMVCVALCAIWVTDARRGIVPDVFTLGPLAILLVVALWQHEWTLLVSAAVPFVPFAIAAVLSRGRGMGWGDVKLVALGGALLGAQTAILAFALACIAAVALNYARGRKRGAIAFAPYLATAIAAGIPLNLWR